MRIVESVAQLRLPNKHEKFLNHFLRDLASLACVTRVFLFGSLARGDGGKSSDLDLMILGNEFSEQDEMFIYTDCGPDFKSDYRVPCDLINRTEDLFEEALAYVGSLEWRVNHEGVDLTSILRSNRDRRFRCCRCRADRF